MHRRVDVQALGCDFYVFTGHKLYGPTGIGVLWGRRALLEAMPPFLGGGDMISSVTFERTTWAEVPHKFEAGTPAILEAIGLTAAIGYVQAIGYDAIGAHEASLLDRMGPRRQTLSHRSDCLNTSQLRPIARRIRELTSSGGRSPVHTMY